MDKITLKNMRFFGYHGCEDFEQRHGQMFEVDVELRVDAKPAGFSDQLADAVNYVDIFNKIKAVVESERYDLLEKLAERIAESVLADERVPATTVRVRKPGAPLAGFFDCVEVEIHRERTL